MADPVLHDVALTAKEDAGGGLVHLVLTPPAELAASYGNPGQYVVASAGAKRAYFVLAGDPGAVRWELIVRPQGEAAVSILGVSLGHTLSVSPAQGAGFPMAEGAGKELLVVVTGSGLAAGRPVVRARVRGGEARATELLVGVRARAELPLTAELHAWAAEGVKVTVCLSREDAPELDRGVSFAAGYVQDVARRHAKAAPRARSLIFAAGVRAMIDGVRALAQELGVDERDVRTNY